MEVKKAKIGNALTSSAANHVVAVSEDIYDESKGRYQSDINEDAVRAKIVADKAAADVGVDSITLLQGGIDSDGKENVSSYYLRTSRFSTFKLEVNDGYTIGQIAQYDLAGNFVKLYNGYQSLVGVEWNPTSVVATDKNYYWVAIIFKGNSPTVAISPREAVVKTFVSGLHYYMQGGEGDPQSAAQQAKMVVERTIEQLPNEEDLVLVDEKMQLANRAAAIKDGKVANLGYVILRPDKSFAEQVAEPNCIYEIRYEFDLGGETVTLKEGCNLKFSGGQLSNGVIKGHNTLIGDNARFNDVNFDGTFVNKSIKISWFLSNEISHKYSYLQAASLAHLNRSWLDGENISLLFDGGVVINALNFKAKNLNISFTTNSDGESLFSYEGSGNLSNIENSEFWYLGDGAGGWHKGVNVLSKNNWTDNDSTIYRNIKWYYFTGYFYVCKNYLQEAVFADITGYSGGGFINFNSDDKKGSANAVVFDNVAINATANYNGVNGYPSRLYCTAEYLYNLHNCMELTFNNCVCQGRTGFVEKTAMQIISDTAALSTSSIYLNGFWCEYNVSGDEKNVKRKIVVNANTDITILKNGLIAFDILDTSSVNIRFYANAPISLVDLVKNITYSDSAKLSMDINCGLTNATYDKWTPAVMTKLSKMMEDGVIKELNINNSAYYNSQTPRLNIDISLAELWDVKKTLIESITYPYIKSRNLRTSIKDISNIPCLCIEHDASLGHTYNSFEFPFKYSDFLAAKKNPSIMIDMIYRVTPLSAFGDGEAAYFSSDIFDPVKSEQYIYQCSESDAVGVPSQWMRVFGCYTFNTGNSMTYAVQMTVKNCNVEIAKLDIAHNSAVINNTGCHIVDGNLVGVNPHEIYSINMLTDDMSIFDTSAFLQTKTAIYKKMGDSMQKFALIPSSAKTLGTTTERPTGVSAGTQYFDTTISKPIWWTGEKWVDSTGTEV